MEFVTSVAAALVAIALYDHRKPVLAFLWVAFSWAFAAGIILFVIALPPLMIAVGTDGDTTWGHAVAILGAFFTWVELKLIWGYVAKKFEFYRKLGEKPKTPSQSDAA